MAITLYHHPFSRAANVVWMLEEAEVPYELRWVDIAAGDQKKPEILALNPMGKLPILVDGDAVVTELAAIALYVGDRYAYGRLSPKHDDPARGTYFRWSFFSPSVIEPGSMAKAANWTYRETAAGFGAHTAMMAAIESAIAGRDYLLGKDFSMADVVFGGTLRYMTMFKMMDASPAIASYVERVTARPAFKRSEELNAKIREERGLNHT
jgi:glutathione S-transferase